MTAVTANLNDIESSTCVCQTGDQPHQSRPKRANTWKTKKSVKMLAMYGTMVVVSTTAIFFLEHATLVNAFRTALVAAIGKTVAAHWVCGIFE